MWLNLAAKIQFASWTESANVRQNKNLFCPFKPPSPRRVSDEPSTLPPPLKETQPDSDELSPPSCSGSRSPQKLSQSAEIFSSELVQSRTPPQLGPNQETLETSDLSYVFSPPAVLQTPPRGATTPLAVAESSTPSLEFIFSPPLTRSMARRRSSGITPGSQSFIRYWVLSHFHEGNIDDI